MNRDNIIRLHRMVELPVRTLDDIARECEGQPDFRETRHIVIREPLFDRIADALGSRSFLIFYSGFYAGALFTAIMAYAWERAL